MQTTGASSPASRLAKADTTIGKARTKDSLQSFAKLTHLVDGKPRIISDPPLIVPLEELFDGRGWDDLEQELRALFRDYRRTLTTDRRRLLEQYDLAHISAQGRRCRQRRYPRLDRALPRPRRRAIRSSCRSRRRRRRCSRRSSAEASTRNSGQRVVAGQRLMQSASDMFLGWKRVAAGSSLDGRQHDYYVRQLHDWKGSADIETMKPGGMVVYGRLCGWTLARAHARSGDRIAIASYLGGGDVFDRAIATFSEAYADQNERDYAVLVDAVKSGRIEAETGL